MTLPILLVASQLLALAATRVPASGGVRSAAAEVRALRRLSNAAIARHDVATLEPLFAEDMHVTTGAGLQRSGKGAVRDAFLAAFADPTFVTYVRTPRRVEASESGEKVAESGDWVGVWRKADGEMRRRGRYMAMWRKIEGRWVIASELFVELACGGSADCSK